jgi:hypothetical protein
LIGRFAEKVRASTWWDVYGSAPDLKSMGGQLLDMMKGSKEIHFNLDGMIGNGQTIEDIVKMGAQGVGEGNMTNWELYKILTNEDFFSKTTFYLNGKVYSGVKPFLP